MAGVAEIRDLHQGLTGDLEARGYYINQLDGSEKKLPNMEHRDTITSFMRWSIACARAY